MKTKAVRLHGKRDLRLEELEFPPIREDKILARVSSRQAAAPATLNYPNIAGGKKLIYRQPVSGAPAILCAALRSIVSASSP